MKKRYKKLIINTSLVTCFLIGITLTCINIYGLFQEIQPQTYLDDELRFGKDDISLTYKEAVKQIQRNNDESIKKYANRVNNVIAKRLAHIHWLRYNNTRFNQLVPIWENYFLYFMGKVSGIPEYKRYHFTNYKRSLNRGIGICGDASMVMSQVLDKEGISNSIVAFQDHVVTSVNFTNEESQVYDPDFGVIIPYSINEIQKDPSIISEYYQKQGYSEEEINVLKDTYGKNKAYFNGVSHFVTNKYYFEKISYFLKWPLPIFLIFLSIYVFQLHKKEDINTK